MCLFIYSFIYSFVYSSVYSFIHRDFIYLNVAHFYVNLFTIYLNARLSEIRILMIS